MARRSSSSQEVLLGLLTVEPMSGYDLGQSIRTSIGFFWNESYGQIYPTLKRLAAAGLVTAKTGTLDDASGLAGYATTSTGQDAVFMIAENGAPAYRAHELPEIARRITSEEHRRVLEHARRLGLRVCE